jgi:hypothetical protein
VLVLSVAVRLLSVSEGKSRSQKEDCVVALRHTLLFLGGLNFYIVSPKKASKKSYGQLKFQRPPARNLAVTDYWAKARQKRVG